MQRMAVTLCMVLALSACGGADDGVDPNVDRDGDGIGNALDECPNDPEDFNDYRDTDGCPDTAPPPDADSDGVPDATDVCPGQAETPNGYEDNDGCPDTPPVPPDADRDGVPDSSDACPTAAENINGNRDGDGCPDLSSLYTGRWRGTATLQFQGEAPWFNNTVVLDGSVDGASVRIVPVCPLGDGSFVTNRFTSEFEAQWEGSMNCAPIAFTNGCQYVVLTYQAAAFSLSTDGRSLGAAGGGTATGCGITKPFQMTFSGVRQ